VLIGAQAAIAIVLLVIAGLLTQSVVRLATIDIGYDIDKLIAVSVRSGGSPWSAGRQQAFWQAAPARIRQVPSITHAALVSIAPFSVTTVPRLPSGRAVNRIEASADYFQTLGLRLLRGRSFTAEEGARAWIQPDWADKRIVGVVAHGVRQLKNADAPTIYLPLTPSTKPGQSH
jgi:hypothetical protein